MRQLDLVVMYFAIVMFAGSQVDGAPWWWLCQQCSILRTQQKQNARKECWTAAELGRTPNYAHI